MKKYLNSIPLFLVLTLCFQAVISLWLSQMQNPISAVLVQVTFSKFEFLKLVGEWNNIDRSLFLMHYLADFIYPFVYARLVYLLIISTAKQAEQLKQPASAILDLAYIPALASISDLLENSLHLLMVGSYIQIEQWPVAAAAFFSMVKWIGLFCCVLVVVLVQLRIALKKSF